MPTTPGQLAAQMRERNTPLADRIEEEIEARMKALTGLDRDGSFEFQTEYGESLNPVVHAILQERYGRADGTGWLVAFHDPDLIELTPQKPDPAPRETGP